MVRTRRHAEPEWEAGANRTVTLVPPTNGHTGATLRVSCWPGDSAATDVELVEGTGGAAAEEEEVRGWQHWLGRCRRACLLVLRAGSEMPPRSPGAEAGCSGSLLAAITVRSLQTSSAKG